MTNIDLFLEHHCLSRATDQRTARNIRNQDSPVRLVVEEYLQSYTVGFTLSIS